MRTHTLTALGALTLVIASGCGAGTAGVAGQADGAGEPAGGGDDAAALRPTYRVSGAVDGDVLASVTVSLAGGSTRTTMTSATGAFAFSGAVARTYTVTPSKAGFTFEPLSRIVEVRDGNVAGQDFTATRAAATYTISGFVSGAVLQGVTMTLSGTASGARLTTATGAYAFKGVVNGTYTVTPSRPGFVFSPPSLTVTVSGRGLASRNFTAAFAPTHALSGAVTGATAEGVTVTLDGDASATARTALDGTYAFTGLANGSYTLTPSRAGYTFTPRTRSVAVSGADVEAEDFVAAVSTSTAPVLDPGFPRCAVISGRVLATTSLTITTGGPRHLVVGTAWYAFSTDPYPLTVTWAGGTPAGASAWVRQTWPDDGTIHWTAQIFTAAAAGALTDQQVIVRRPNATDYTDALTCVWSFSGASGFAAATDHHSPILDVSRSLYVPADVTVRATAADSVLVGILTAGEIDANHLGYGGHVTPRANTTVDLDHVVDGSGQAAFRMTGATAAPGPYTVGITNRNRAYAVEAIEVLPE